MTWFSLTRAVVYDPSEIVQMPTPPLTGCATSFLNCPCLQAWPSPTIIETGQPLCEHGHKSQQLMLHLINIPYKLFSYTNQCTLKCTVMCNECESVIRIKTHIIQWIHVCHLHLWRDIQILVCQMSQQYSCSPVDSEELVPLECSATTERPARIPAHTSGGGWAGGPPVAGSCTVPTPLHYTAQSITGS